MPASSSDVEQFGAEAEPGDDLGDHDVADDDRAARQRLAQRLLGGARRAASPPSRSTSTDESTAIIAVRWVGGSTGIARGAARAARA